MLRKNKQRLTAVVEYILRSAVHKVGGLQGSVYGRYRSQLCTKWCESRLRREVVSWRTIISSCGEFLRRRQSVGAAESGHGSRTEREKERAAGRVVAWQVGQQQASGQKPEECYQSQVPIQVSSPGGDPFRGPEHRPVSTARGFPVDTSCATSSFLGTGMMKAYRPLFRISCKYNNYSFCMHFCSLGRCIPLFRSITMFYGTDDISRSILIDSPHSIWNIFNPTERCYGFE